MNSSDHSQTRPAHEMFALVYEELRQLARCKMSSEPAGQTLQPTALVHEAYLRLAGRGQNEWKSRRYFFGAAAEAMRRILIEAARRKRRQRRGGGWERLDLESFELPSPMASEQLIALSAALDRFEEQEPGKAELVKLKFFAGLTTAEAAKLLGVSEPTAKRYWAFSRAWLFREIQRESSPTLTET